MKNRTGVMAALVLWLLAGWHITAAQETVKVNKPFPYHTDYVAGTVRPANDKEMARQVIGFYGEWCRKYLKRITDDQLAVDGEDRGLISEGQGYGMVIVVLMARPDGSGRDTFNMLYNYYMAHRVDRRGSWLMRWDSSDGSSAADGDLDIAYALLLAHKQWGSDGAVNYKKAALAVIGDIRKWEVDTLDWTILSSNMIEGDSKRKGYKEYHSLRVSDFMPSHLMAFREATGNDDWLKIIKGTYRVFDTLQAKRSAVGLWPDFTVNIDKDPAPAPAHFQGRKEKHCDSYDYNACRVPWRLGVSYLLYGDTAAQKELRIVNSSIRKLAGEKADSIRDGYKLNGDAQNKKPDNMHLSYVAPLGVSAMIDGANEGWLKDIWVYLNSKTIHDYEVSNTRGYYDSTIKMYCMIILSGNYWKYSEKD